MFNKYRNGESHVTVQSTLHVCHFVLKEPRVSTNCFERKLSLQAFSFTGESLKTRINAIVHESWKNSNKDTGTYHLTSLLKVLVIQHQVSWRASMISSFT